MNYIHPCPNCRVDLRFPLTKGILNVTCPNCQYRFQINPDEPSLYQIGSFDLSTSKKTTVFERFREKFSNQYTNTERFKFLIPFLLFLFLFLQLNRTCSLQNVNLEENKAPREEFKQEAPPSETESMDVKEI